MIQNPQPHHPRHIKNKNNRFTLEKKQSHQQIIKEKTIWFLKGVKWTPWRKFICLFSLSEIKPRTDTTLQPIFLFHHWVRSFKSSLLKLNLTVKSFVAKPKVSLVTFSHLRQRRDSICWSSLAENKLCVSSNQTNLILLLKAFYLLGHGWKCGINV